MSVFSAKFIACSSGRRDVPSPGIYIARLSEDVGEKYDDEIKKGFCLFHGSFHHRQPGTALLGLVALFA